MNNHIKYSTGILLTAFAILTLFLSTSVIFDLFEVRAKEGNYVMFVVVANFISSLLYLVSVYGIFSDKKWSYQPLLLSALLLVVAQIAFLFYINNGGIHETKTIGAMFFRVTVTAIFAFIIFRQTKEHKNN
jgi:hypothetical protein